MKNVIVLVLMCILQSTHAQCFITGNSTLFVGQETNYVVDEIAQCKDCYQWTIGNGEEVIFTSVKNVNNIQLKGMKVGRVNLSLSMFTHHGLVQCSKSIDVIDKNTPLGTSSTSAPINCDVDVSDFKELRYSDTQIIFVPNLSQKKIAYQWLATYQSGAEQQVDDKSPVLECTSANPIVEVKLRINSTVCTRKFSKTYPESFWKALK